MARRPTRATASKSAKKPRKIQRTLDAVRDTLDFRDRMFVPTLIEVAPRIPLRDYLAWKVPILNQGTEGACTGFGLATVANYLLRRRRDPEKVNVSPRMLYEMAKRYDEWPGEKYEGSSARGAMKGWHKHGICLEADWPFKPKKALAAERWQSASRRPLGAYFRVNHRDLVAMHSAIAEVGILYATATVHAGWDEVGNSGIIPLREKELGGHAFAIVGYDDRGFWIQNSWGTRWGREGFGLVSYDDWLDHGTDVWVARLGAPVKLHTAEAMAVSFTAAAKGSRSYVFCDLQPHIVSLGNDGELRTDGTYGTDATEVADIFRTALPRVTAHWKKKRVLLYAHGGLVPEDSALQRVADYRAAMLEAEIYPLAFIWRTDFWTTLKNILDDALSRRKPEGILDASKDFMLDRLDDALEPLARLLSGKSQWDEMKENALLATTSAKGGARVVLSELLQLCAKDPTVEVHVAGHSAGSILLAPLVERLAAAPLPSGPRKGKPVPIESCTLWAPAITTALFKTTYLPAAKSGRIKRLALFTLTDEAEQDDSCAGIYHKSLLYLVSHAFERKARIPVFRSGEPILGMEKCIEDDKELRDFFRAGTADWVLSPNDAPLESGRSSRAKAHGAFDDDEATLRATLRRILAQETDVAIPMHRSATSQRDLRSRLSLAGVLR